MDLRVPATPGHFTERYRNGWELMVMVPLAGEGIAFAVIWRGSLIRVWSRAAGRA